MSQSREIKVVSSYGDIVTFEEHVSRLSTYFEAIKRDILELTKGNDYFYHFLQKMHLVYGDIYFTENHCKYYLHIATEEAKQTVPPQSEWQASISLDDNGYPLLIYHFLTIKTYMRAKIVYDFFMPQFISDTAFFQEFVKDILVGIFDWKYVSNDKINKCVELTFHYKNIDYTFFMVSKAVKVLIGSFQDIKECLQNFKEEYSRKDIFIIDIDYDKAKLPEMYTNLFEELFKEEIY